MNFNPKTALTLRAVALCYVLYIVYEIIQGYVTGDPEALPLPVLIIAVAIMAGAALFLLLLTWKQWKKLKEEEAQEKEEAPEEENGEA